MTYKKHRIPRTGEVDTGCIVRKADNAFIPVDEMNRDYQEYLAWVAAGNTAEAAD
jgi:hypothetical protein